MLKLPTLGPRKLAVCQLVPKVSLGADVGTDHGIISAHLLREGICSRMILSDISAASLEKAKRLFALHGMQDQADFRVADGLRALEEPVGAVVIAGMGGLSICDILQGGMDKIGRASLILQPQTDAQVLRKWLATNGFRIDAERLAVEGRRYYVVIRAVKGKMRLDGREAFLGPCLLSEPPETWGRYLSWMEGNLTRVQSQDASGPLEWVRREMENHGMHSQRHIPRD